MDTDLDQKLTVSLEQTVRVLPARTRAESPPISAGARTSVPDQAFAAFLAQRRFGSLDGLRALGVLAVVWHHTVARGFGGVSLFFALSGFLIATRLLRAKRHGGIFVGEFYRRTARRILPLYFAVLAIYLALAVWIEPVAVARREFFAHLPAFATFTANWFVDLDQPRVIFYFAWSLSAQMQFYLLWPWVERTGSSRRAATIAGVLLVTAPVIALMAGSGARESLWLRIVSGVPAGIMAGVLVAQALHAPAGFAALNRWCGRRGSVVAALALVILLAWRPTIGGAWHEMLTALAHAGLIVTCVVREDHDFATILRWKVIVQVGAVSYGIYLLHMLAVNVVRHCEHWGSFQSVYFEFTLSVLVAFGLALASHRWWERRFLVERAG